MVSSFANIQIQEQREAARQRNEAPAVERPTLWDSSPPQPPASVALWTSAFSPPKVRLAGVLLVQLLLSWHCTLIVVVVAFGLSAQVNFLQLMEHEQREKVRQHKIAHKSLQAIQIEEQVRIIFIRSFTCDFAVSV